MVLYGPNNIYSRRETIFMTEFWTWFLYIGGGLIFIVSVLDSLIRFIKWYRQGKATAGKQIDGHIKDVLAEDRLSNCPYINGYKRDIIDRQRENDLLREFILKELKPIKEGLEEVRSWNKKMHHAIMDNLKVDLRAIYARFERKGTMSKNDQTNWDKYYSNYFELGGNSDIKRMDDIIQKARLEVTLGKARTTKEEKEDNED